MTSKSLVVQTTGGIPPFLWSFVSNGLWVLSFDQATGTFTGPAPITGTFFGTVGVLDATQHPASQNLTLTVDP